MSHSQGSTSTSHELSKLKEMLALLKSELQYVKGVGPKKASVFRKTGITTIEDLLFFLPRDYEDRRRIKRIAELKPGERAVFVGEVWSAGVVGEGRKIFEVVFRDTTGVIKAKWFNFHLQGFKKRFKEGEKFLVVGDVKYNRFERCLEVIHPETRLFDLVNIKDFARILPLYPGLEGISDKNVQEIVGECIKRLKDVYVEYIPENILEREKLVSLPHAFEVVHFALDEPEKLRARRSKGHIRLIFEEFFLPQLALAVRKHGLKAKKGVAFKIDSKLLKKFLQSLPFELTNAQKRVLKEILSDMKKPYPMNRLLQGDVGCGKTVVAVCAALVAVDSGYQVAFMAPTEILAEQHYRTISEFTRGLGLSIFLLTSSTPSGEKRIIKHTLSIGQAQIVVGTHALIQKDVRFKNLGLVIIDEQHKFGVIQRKILREKGEFPDLLVMTATPIPRTLALTVYGDLDVSIIDEMPKGRKPVITRVIKPKDREKAYLFVESQLRKGRQAYFVFPLIEESEKLNLPSVIEAYPRIKERFREFSVGLLHGRMKGEEKERVMRAFKEGKIQLLVCTTVIEVGVDVPNATVMIIEGAERFGLSQLHQLRGRIGRGPYKSYCLLMISENATLSKAAYARLKIMEETTDGFRIAEEDLKIRGPGELLGTKQAGVSDLRVANLLKDQDILQRAREAAFSVVEEDSTLEKGRNRLLNYLITEKGLLDRVVVTESG